MNKTQRLAFSKWWKEVVRIEKAENQPEKAASFIEGIRLIMSAEHFEHQRFWKPFLWHIPREGTDSNKSYCGRLIDKFVSKTASLYDSPGYVVCFSCYREYIAEKGFKRPEK